MTERVSNRFTERSSTGNLAAMPHYAGTGLDAITRRATVAEVMSELSEGLA